MNRDKVIEMWFKFRKETGDEVLAIEKLADALTENTTEVDKTYDPFTSQEAKDLMLGKSEEENSSIKAFLDKRVIELGYEDIFHYCDCRDYEQQPFDMIVFLNEYAKSHPHTDGGKERYEAAMEYVDECTRDMDSIDTTMVAKIASGYNHKGE